MFAVIHGINPTHQPKNFFRSSLKFLHIPVRIDSLLNRQKWLGFGSGLSPFAPGTMGTLVAIPFTKLSHVFLFFASRAQLGMDFGIKRGGLKGTKMDW